MAVADILRDIGTGAKAVGAVAAPVLQRTAEVVSGEAPQIDEDKRKRAEKFEDEQIAAKASVLENNLAMGQKYGTLTPDQQQQYIDQITGLYSHPRHAGTLMEKLRKAIHPNGAVATAPQSSALPNAIPPGGTAAVDAKRAEDLADLRRPTREYQSPDGKERNWFRPGDEPDGWQAVQGAPHKSTAKSPPTPGNQIPQDAVGPDGQPIAPELRNTAHSFIQWNGAWYAAPKPKPTMKTVGSDLLLIDPQTGQVMRKIATAGAKVTSHQTPFVGDDQQMHMLTTYSVTTPQGESIDVEAPPPEMPGETPSGGTKQPEAPKTPAKKVNPGSILPKTGAKTPSAGPVIPGSHAWAQTKSPVFKADVAQYTKASEDARAKKLAFENAQGLLADPNRKTDLELVYAWVRANVQGAGRMTNTEIQQTKTAGSLPQRAANALDQATTGRLSPEMEQEFFGEIKRSYENAQKEADDLKNGLQGQPAPAAPLPKIDDKDPLGLFK